MCVPGRVIRLEALRRGVLLQALQRGVQFADVMPLHALDLVDIGRVDVEMRDRFSARRKARKSQEHPSELPSLMRISYSVFCFENNTKPHKQMTYTHLT